jgi:beta-glucosidase
MTTIDIEGLVNAHPYDEKVLAPYYTGNIREISDAAFESLIGRPIPKSTWDRSQPLGYNDTISQCRYAKGWIGRLSYRLVNVAHAFLWKIGKRETANLIMMSVYHMPFRGYARMTGGAINMPMVDGMLTAINGQFFKGMRQIFIGRKKLKK